MKHIDSKNSLAELNPEDPTCFICLEHENELAEPVLPSAMLRTCGCKFVVHPQCWNTWMKDKTHYDCPICRNKSSFLNRSPTPLHAFLATSPEIPDTTRSLFVPILGSLFILAIILITIFVIYTKNDK